MELNLKIREKSDKILKLREENLKTFKKKGFPSKRKEDWKFTDLERILNENFKELNNEQFYFKKPKTQDLKFNHNSITLINGKLEAFDFKSEKIKNKNFFSIKEFETNHHLNFANEFLIPRGSIVPSLKNPPLYDVSIASGSLKFGKLTMLSVTIG